MHTEPVGRVLAMGKLGTVISSCYDRTIHIRRVSDGVSLCVFDGERGEALAWMPGPEDDRGERNLTPTLIRTKFKYVYFHQP